MSGKRILIIGGSDAGISAALRARELDDTANITVLLADSFPNYSICGLPFYLSGETPDWHKLAHRTEFEGIEVRRNSTALSIDATEKTVTVEEQGLGPVKHPYDRLVICTGAVPVRPPIAGLDLPGVFPLHTMADSFRFQEFLTEHRPQSAVVIGAGYIGVEMVDALTHRGLDVTLMSRPATVLPTVDPELGQMVEHEMQSHKVKVINRAEVETIEQDGSQLVVRGKGGLHANAGLVLVATGVRPASELALTAGIRVGVNGAIEVNRRMETNVSGIFAAGDCVGTWHRLMRRNTYLPLGTTSHKQGRTAGENATGGHKEFAGSLGTQVVKVFNLVIARTGLREREAMDAGFDPVTAEAKFWDHKAYYPGAQEMRIRVTGDRASGRLLGAQIVGQWKSEVSKRIDIFAAALFHEMLTEDLNDIDLSYTPPLSSPWDPVQMSAQRWTLEQRETKEVHA
jgi:NADPH-dependent 2,4-dienoyl-CoA reductase/sulfur reductase-like enzyme